jgi:hypothetical protein
MANELESVTPTGRELAGTVLEAFTRHRLVGIGESHGLQNHHDALQMLLTDPRRPRPCGPAPIGLRTATRNACSAFQNRTERCRFRARSELAGLPRSSVQIDHSRAPAPISASRSW